MTDKNRLAVKNFLCSYKMYYEDIDFIKNCGEFVSEMELGLSSTEGSLSMIPTYVMDVQTVIRDKSVIALDAGGTNLRVSVVDFDKEGTAAISYFKKYEMPGTDGEIDQQDFFDTIAKYLAPALSYSDKIGFCFSYPTRIFPDQDGTLIRFTKEVNVSGMNGLRICESLKEALKRNGYDGNKKIVLINDSVATLLGGKAVNPSKVYDGNIGLILGTGINTAYSEHVGKIKKVAGSKDNDGQMIINLESGGYGKICRGILDEEFDLQTIDPGKQKFEKMISGAYQGKLLQWIINKAISDGLFSRDVPSDGIHNLTTKDINQYIINPYSYEQNILTSSFTNGDDRIKLYFMIDSIVQRAARLVAVNIAAIMQKRGIGSNPLEPACLSVEGTTFYASKAFRLKFYYYIKKYINDELSMFLDVVMAENLTIIGTAIAGAI